MARDIVCDMLVDENDAAAQGLTTRYAGETFYFCSSACKDQFDLEPAKFCRGKPIESYTDTKTPLPPPIEPMPPVQGL